MRSLSSPMRRLRPLLAVGSLLVLHTTACPEPSTNCNNGGGGGSGRGGSLGAGGGTTGTTTVTGRVTYDFVPTAYTPGGAVFLDFARASARPVRRGVVQVIQGNTILRSEEHTSEL